MKIRVSVCMATYNGALYIRHQLDSILSQLDSCDEIVVVDDNSTDDTYAIVNSYADKRIKLCKNEVRLGHVQNFAKAIASANGEFIALSDQDDVWVEGRLDKMLEIAEKSPVLSLIIGDYAEINEKGELNGRSHRLTASPFSMFRQFILIFTGKTRYFGCTFLFRRELKNLILPIPSKMEAHDIWISMNACIYGYIVHTNQIGLLHRIHGSNLTPTHRRSTFKAFKARLIYIYSILVSKINW